MNKEKPKEFRMVATIKDGEIKANKEIDNRISFFELIGIYNFIKENCRENILTSGLAIYVSLLGRAVVVKATPFNIPNSTEYFNVKDYLDYLSKTEINRIKKILQVRERNEIRDK